jgi:hypothetical protein
MSGNNNNANIIMNPLTQDKKKEADQKKAEADQKRLAEEVAAAAAAAKQKKLAENKQQIPLLSPPQSNPNSRLAATTTGAAANSQSSQPATTTTVAANSQSSQPATATSVAANSQSSQPATATSVAANSPPTPPATSAAANSQSSPPATSAAANSQSSQPATSTAANSPPTPPATSVAANSQSSQPATSVAANSQSSQPATSTAANSQSSQPATSTTAGATTVAATNPPASANNTERYAIIKIDAQQKITVLDSYASNSHTGSPSELLKQKTESVFAIKVTKIDPSNTQCIEDTNTKCITYDNITYKLDLSTAFNQSDVQNHLIGEDFLGIVATTTASNVPVTTASNGPGTNVSNVPLTNVSNGPGTNVSNVPLTNVSNVPLTNVSNGPLTTASNVPLTNVSNVPLTNVSNVPLTTASTASVTTTTGTAATATNDDGCKELVQDISGRYYEESGNITQISDFYKYIPIYLFLNNILHENKNCSNETKTDIHTIMDNIYMMPINFDKVLSNLDQITDIKDLYELMQFVSVTGDYTNLTAAAISKKLEDLLSVPTSASTTTATSLNMIAPSNASNSCWLNSILMAYLVPLYVTCGNNVDQLKKNITFLDGQLYIVDLIHKYIDAHFGKNDRTKYNGSEIIRDIKKYLVRPTVFGELNEYYHLITPDGTNNQHTFLSNALFDFKSVLNKSQKITNITNGMNEQMNVVPLNINATMSMSIDASNNNLLTIDNRIYQIDKDISFITFQSETEGGFSKSVQEFLKPEITVGKQVYKQVSFLLAGRGHFVVVVKNNKLTNTYSMIDDLPPTIKDISQDQVNSLISDRTQLLDGYYVTGIVYMRNGFVCPTPFDQNVVDVNKLKQENTDVKAAIIDANTNFKDDIEKAIHIYSDTTTNNTKNDFNKNQLNALKRLLQREFPQSTVSGGSRKNRGQKSKKTKRKYYVYAK